MKVNSNSGSSPPSSSSTITTSADPTASASNESCFKRLPDEILSPILGHLNLIELNHAALANPSLRDAVRNKKTSLQLPGSELAKTLERFPNIQEIKILDSYSEQISDEDVRKIAGVKEQVQHLDLSCRLHSAPNKDAERFSFQDLRWEYPLSNEGTIALTQKFPNLTALDLSGRYKLTDNDILALVEKCEKLTSLDLRFCNRVTNDAITKIRALRPNLEVTPPIRLDVQASRIAENPLWEVQAFMVSENGRRIRDVLSFLR